MGQLPWLLPHLVVAAGDEGREGPDPLLGLVTNQLGQPGNPFELGPGHLPHPDVDALYMYLAGLRIRFWPNSGSRALYPER